MSVYYDDLRTGWWAYKPSGFGQNMPGGFADGLLSEGLPTGVTSASAAFSGTGAFAPASGLAASSQFSGQGSLSPVSGQNEFARFGGSGTFAPVSGQNVFAHFTGTGGFNPAAVDTKASFPAITIMRNVALADIGPISNTGVALISKLT